MPHHLRLISADLRLTFPFPVPLLSRSTPHLSRSLSSNVAASSSQPIYTSLSTSNSRFDIPLTFQPLHHSITISPSPAHVPSSTSHTVRQRISRQYKTHPTTGPSCERRCRCVRDGGAYCSTHGHKTHDTRLPPSHNIHTHGTSHTGPHTVPHTVLHTRYPTHCFTHDTPHMVQDARYCTHGPLPSLPFKRGMATGGGGSLLLSNEASDQWGC